MLLSGAISSGRTTPVTVMYWRSLLIMTSLLPSTNRLPLGNTSRTTAVTVALRAFLRVVVPLPSKPNLSDASATLPGLIAEEVIQAPGDRGGAIGIGIRLSCGAGDIGDAHRHHVVHSARLA